MDVIYGLIDERFWWILKNKKNVKNILQASLHQMI